MVKQITELTDDEFDQLASEAWFEASRSALQAGVPVVGRDKGKIVKRFPDGRVEVLGNATPLERVQASPADNNSSHSEQSKKARDIA